MAKYVIDIQGFAIVNSFIVKELSFVSLNSQKVFHFLVKSPFNKEYLSKDEQRQVSWLQTHHHMIKWEDGVFKFSEMIADLRRAIRDADVLYAKGREKAAFIQMITGKFTIDLDQLDCPRANCLPKSKLSNVITCNHDSHMLPNAGTKCSLFQALKFKEWLAYLFKRGVDEVG